MVMHGSIDIAWCHAWPTCVAMLINFPSPAGIPDRVQETQERPHDILESYLCSQGFTIAFSPPWDMSLDACMGSTRPTLPSECHWLIVSLAGGTIGKE